METSKKSIAEVVTAKMIEKLEAGTIPWRKPWRTLAGAGAPKNLVTGRPYRGINIFILACQEYESPWWLTFKQAQDKGGHIRRGEHGTPVVFWNWVHVDATESEEEKNIPYLRHYTVFNLAQAEGIAAPVTEEVPDNYFTPVEATERVVAGMPHPPQVQHRENVAWYRPSTDLVNLPQQTSFENSEEYYSTLFHELAHSTGHASRLSRKGVTDVIAFASYEYSREELVAEMTAAFLCAETGILPATIDNSAAYVQGWLKELKNDKGLVIMAAAQAQKAFDWIMGRKSEEEMREAA